MQDESHSSSEAGSGSTHGGGPQPNKIWIDDQEYQVSAHELSGEQVKKLAGKPDAAHLFLEQAGADLPVENDEVVQVASGEHFRTTPLRKAYRIFIDDVEYLVESEELTGAQIKTLGGKPDNYQLFLERPGKPDKQIQNDEVVRMKDGEHFHTVPPANFG
jgi:hypothetical protein